MFPPRPHTSMVRLIAFAGLAGFASACGGPSEERVPVYRASGKITFEGKPLPGALVIFRKAEVDPKIPSPMATTAEDGTFTLHTYEPDDGAPEGDYLVAVSTVVQRSHDGGGGILSRKENEKSSTSDILKGRYADPKTSGLKAAIKPLVNTLDPIDLAPTGGSEPKASSTNRDR